MSESRISSRPIMSVAVRPRSDSDQEKLQRALNDLAQQDPTFRVETNQETGQTVISGMGELHLEVIVDRIVREHKIPLEVGKPQVAYLETIRKTSEAEGKFIRAISSHHTYGHVKLRLEPLTPGGGYEFVNEIVDGVIPSEFVEPINLGIQQAMKSGVLAGHQVVDLRAVLYDGSSRPGSSNEIGFKIAASTAFKEAARKASPVILEPVMSIEVVTPEDFMGTIMNDLTSRRGQIEGMEIRDDAQAIRASVPLAEMFGYANNLRYWTQGRALYSMQFARYEQAPRGRASGGDEAGVTANTPKGPGPRSGRASVNPDEESA